MRRNGSVYLVFKALALSLYWKWMWPVTTNTNTNLFEGESEDSLTWQQYIYLFYTLSQLYDRVYATDKEDSGESVQEVLKVASTGLQQGKNRDFTPTGTRKRSIFKSKLHPPYRKYRYKSQKTYQIQAFNMNPVNFTDPYGKLIRAEYGRHDVFKTEEVKTGKWYLDYTIVGAFNELRNASALAINLASNLLGTTDDIAFDVADYGLSKVGMIERGELRDDIDTRNFINAMLLINGEALANGSRYIISKADDLTFALSNLLKSKGGKILNAQGNFIVSSGAELSGDDLARVLGGDDIYSSFDDIPLMSTDDVKDALKSGNYTKGTNWAYSIHDHHLYPKWLGGNPGGPETGIRGFEHITDLEPELFSYIKKRIPQITTKSERAVRSLIKTGVVTQKKITQTLFKFYKSLYPNLSDEVIMDALKAGVK